MVSLRLGQKYHCLQEGLQGQKVGTKRRKTESSLLISNSQSGSGSFSCIVTLNWAKQRDY
jgi:hypothetical protein